MKTLILMVEEASMKNTLDAVMPKLLPEGWWYRVIVHEGKTDLRKSLPRKLRGWRAPDSYFMIVHDNDGGDCIALKRELTDLANGIGTDPARLKVRIVCQELEAWFIGDPMAVHHAGYINRRTAESIPGKVRFRNPDAIRNPDNELRKLAPEYKKIAGSREIAANLGIDDNNSRSFNCFIEGVRQLTA